MDTINIKVLNPACITLLEDLEKLQLITIHRDDKVNNPSKNFIDLVQKLRSKSNILPSMDEITAEVEQQRAEMYAFSTEESKGNN